MTHVSGEDCDGSTRLEPRGWPALAVLGTAGLMTMLDNTALYTALPTIQETIQIRPGDLHWAMSAYLLGFGGVLITAGRIAGAVGYRRVFTLGIAGFAAASALAGVAWAGPILIAARAIQGTAAAVMASTMLPLLMASAGQGAWRRRALGTWTAIGALGGTIGLLVGGPVTDGPGWRWMFFWNALVGTGVCLAARFVLGESRVASRCRPIGLARMIALALAFAALGYGMTAGPQVGWTSATTIGALSLSVVLLSIFALIEFRSKQPVVPARLRRSWPFLGAVAALFVAGMAADGLLLSVTLYTQHALSFSATMFGLVAALVTISSVVGSLVGQLSAVRGVRPVTVVGIALICIGLLVTGASAGAGYSGTVLLGLGIFGSGLGAAFVSAQIAVVSGYPQTQAGAASGTADVAFSFGGVIGLAAISSVLVAWGADAVAEPPPASWPSAEIAGLPVAFAVIAGSAGLGLILTATLLGRPVSNPPTSPQVTRLSARHGAR